MLSDPELSALFDQATRNLYALEVLVRAAGERDDGAIMDLRRRLLTLRKAYTVETNELTRQVLARAVERRLRPDRRRNEVAMETT
jgi:hypothetical protein